MSFSPLGFLLQNPRRAAAEPPPPRPGSTRAGEQRAGSEVRPERRGRRPLPAGLTCLKQKGMVSTLTPTMLFTMFMISPQLEAAAAVIARRLGPGSPGARRLVDSGARGPERDGRLPGGGGLAGRRRGRSTSRPRQAPRPPQGIVPRSLPPAASASLCPNPEELPRCQPGTPQPSIAVAPHGHFRLPWVPLPGSDGTRAGPAGAG